MSSRDRWETIFVLAVVITGMSYIAYRTADGLSKVRPQVTFQQDLKQMDWKNLVLATPLYRSDVRKYTPDPGWQEFKASLQHIELPKRYLALERWLQEHQYSKASCVQVTHYVLSLKREGIIE